MSRWSTTVDAIVTDLTGNVTGLQSAGSLVVDLHRYFPWNPENLTVDSHRHLAVWPEPNAEVASPAAVKTFQYDQLFIVLIWESTREGARQVADEAGGKALLDVIQAVADRFMVEANQTMAGGSPLWLARTELAPATAQVRWGAVHLRDRQFQSFT